MKIRNIITLALAGSLIAAACTKEMATDSFDNFKLDKTYLSVSTEGGKTSVKINATEAWKLNCPDSLYWKKSSTWVTPSDTIGTAGESTLVFTAGAGEGRELNLTFTCGKNTQNLVIRQGEMEATVATCKDLLDGKIAQGKTVILEGTCTSIYNTTYGNWYLNDGTGEITIYGTLNNGKTQQFASLGIEAGDKVKVQGPFTIYGTTYELSDVTVLKITKSLVKVESASQTVEKEGGKFTVKVSYKGSNVQPSVPEEYQDWVSITGVEIHEGKATKIETNPADTAYVSVKVAANEGGDRDGKLKFVSSISKSTSEVSYSFTQAGAIVAATVGEFIAAPVGSVQYRITATISKVVNASQGNFNIVDGTGSTYVYKLSGDGVADLKVGDVVTLVGKRGEYNKAHQVASGKLETVHISGVTSVTVKDFLAKSVDSKVYYMLTGKIRKPTDAETTAGCGFNMTQYGNFMLEDETGSVYVYGVLVTYGAKNTQESFAKMDVAEGDTITVIGTRANYAKKNLDQLGNGIFFSRVKAE